MDVDITEDMLEGEGDEATKMLEHATKSDPKNLDAWVSLAWVNVQQNKLGEAEKMIAEAAKQSRRAWFPSVTEMVGTPDVVDLLRKLGDAGTATDEVAALQAERPDAVALARGDALAVDDDRQDHRHRHAQIDDQPAGGDLAEPQARLEREQRQRGERRLTSRLGRLVQIGQYGRPEMQGLCAQLAGFYGRRRHSGLRQRYRLRLGLHAWCLGRGLRLGVIGAAFGLVAALAVSQLLSRVLFGVSALYHRGTWGPRAHALLQIQKLFESGSLEPWFVALGSQYADLRLSVVDRLVDARDERSREVAAQTGIELVDLRMTEPGS